MSFHSRSKLLGERVEKFLRQRHPSKTAAHVAAETGLSVAQIEKWLEGSSAPGGPAIIVLIACYGPDFLAAVLPERFAWLDACRQAQEAARLEGQIAAIQKRLDEIRAL